MIKQSGAIKTDIRALSLRGAKQSTRHSSVIARRETTKQSIRLMNNGLPRAKALAMTVSERKNKEIKTMNKS